MLTEVLWCVHDAAEQVYCTPLQEHLADEPCYLLAGDANLATEGE